MRINNDISLDLFNPNLDTEMTLWQMINQMLYFVNVSKNIEKSLNNWAYQFNHR